MPFNWSMLLPKKQQAPSPEYSGNPGGIPDSIDGIQSNSPTDYGMYQAGDRLQQALRPQHVGAARGIAGALLGNTAIGNYVSGETQHQREVGDAARGFDVASKLAQQNREEQGNLSLIGERNASIDNMQNEIYHRDNPAPVKDAPLSDFEAAFQREHNRLPTATELEQHTKNTQASPTGSFEQQSFDEWHQSHPQGTRMDFEKERAASNRAPTDAGGSFTQAINNAEGQVVGWVDPKSGAFRPVGAVKGLPEAIGGSKDANGKPIMPPKPSALESRTAKNAKYTTALIDDGVDMITQAQDELGVAKGRWNDFVTGKLGLPNAKWTEIAAQTDLIVSAARLAHSQGRISPQTLKIVEDLMAAGKQDPVNILTAMSTLRNAMTRAQEAFGGDESKLPASNAQPTKRSIPLVVRH